MKFLKDILSIVPKWQKIAMIGVFIVVIFIIQNLNSYYWTINEKDDMTLIFAMAYILACFFYGWSLKAYKESK